MYLQRVDVWQGKIPSLNLDHLKTNLKIIKPKTHLNAEVNRLKIWQVVVVSNYTQASLMFSLCNRRIASTECWTWAWFMQKVLNTTNDSSFIHLAWILWQSLISQPGLWHFYLVKKKTPVVPQSWDMKSSLCVNKAIDKAAWLSISQKVKGTLPGIWLFHEKIKAGRLRP